ncbi:ARM repeat-containing protein [Rhizoctonia solani]|uniref:ARM repeat-containing protein n=1 Tax=Rhizoctonia solani TaxID=456999 RepID=A0A8H7I9X3_9AGAM|nr:ARM repeat-containing protein [Rhizoctonia solani]
MLALLALTTIALIGHTGMMVVMTIKLSRRTEESVWRVMAWELDDKLRPKPERRPVSKVLPPVPMGMVEDPPRARNPLTFSTVSSLLNPAPRDLPGSARQEGRFQLHDGPAPRIRRVLDVLCSHARVRSVCEGMSEAFPSSGVGTPVTPALKPPSPLQPRKIQKKDGRWMLADESDALERPLVGEDRPTLPARFQSRMHEIQPPAAAQVTPVRRPSRTPPRIMPATRGVMSNANQMPDLSQLRLHDASPAGRFEQHANTFDGGRGASGGFHYGSTSPTQNLAPGLAQNATIATSPLKQGKPSRAGLPSAWLEQSVAHDDRSFSPPQTTTPVNAHVCVDGGIASPIDDEIIPTAIVIKNIPFTVKRETLLDIIASLSIPHRSVQLSTYHLDTQDAVVAALNGFDVQGRKLRVEYKRCSRLMEKERTQLLNPPSASANEWDDYGTQQGPGSNAYLSPSRSYSSGQAQLAHQLPPMHSPPPPPPQHVPTPTPSQQSTKSASNELDMNDLRLWRFTRQRRVVHLVAQKLGVYHYSVGEGENRYAVVTRIEREVRSPIQRHASQTLSRAATSYLAPSPAAPSLRVKKSMPDMKSLHTPPTSRLQPRASNGNIREGFATISAASPRRPSVQTAFGGVFGSALPSAGDRSYGGVGVGIPPVPSLDSPGGAPSGVVRQPRGPGVGGFTRRATGERLEARTHEPLEMAMNDGDGIPGDGPVGIRPSMGRQLSGGVGLLSQPKSKPGPSPLSAASLAPDTTSRTATSTSTTPNATSTAQMATTPTATTASTPSISSATPSFPRPSAATSSLSAPIPSNSQPNHSLLFSSGPEIVEELLDVPSPAPHIARSSPPPPSEPQPVASLEVRHEREPIVSPRTPPNLRLEIPPQDAPGLARDTTRAPFAPDPENEGICTEVGSLGQEIQLESGDHLNALERIYLYTQSKASFHRIFMSRALPTYLKEVTPTEAVEYVLPLLGGLAIDERNESRRRLSASFWSSSGGFSRVTDQEPEPAPENAEPDPDVIPLVSVQSFSAVLASLLLSSNSEVSATARGTVIELLGRTRWVVAGKDLDQEQTTQFCETMRPVGPWSRGRLGIEEARMIQLEMIYGVIIDLGRLDLNAEVVEDQAAQDALYTLENNEHEDLSTLVPPTDDDSCLDPLVTPTPETSKSYANPMIYSDDEASVSGSETVSSFNQTLESSGTSIELPRSAPASVTTFNHTRALAPASKSAPGIGGNTSSSSSLNLPELSPADSSRSSVASPAEPVSPPENDEPRELSKSSNLSHSESMSLALPRSKISLSLPGSDTDTDNDDMLWHTPRGGEGFESGYFGSSNVTRESSPIATTSRLGVNRPGLERHSSSVSLVSDINPDEYVDAEWVDGEHSLENGVVGNGGGEDEIVVNGVEEGESDPGVGVGTVTNSASAGVTENGTAEGQGGEGWTEDAYIDDGAAAEEAAIGRVASMSLVAAVASSGVVDDEIYTLFIEEVLRISSDPVYWVRSETSYALGTLAKTVTRESVESCLLPILESLVNDTESHVRQSSVYAIPSVLKRLDPQYRRELAIKYMLKLCNDDIEVVRTGSLQVLAEVIHTFHEDKSGPPDELIDFFLHGEKDLVRAPLPKTEAERATPSAEKDLYSHWGAEPSSYFEADPSFPDPDRALICAFNYPAVVLTLGPKRWSRLSGYYTYLAEESWHTPKVRATLAASVARLRREAKLKALTALPLLLESLDGPGRSEVASKLGEAWEKHVSDWKVRDTFARQLSAVVPMLSHEGAVLCRIFKGGLEDRVAAIREAVIDALPVLYQVLRGNHALLKVARDDLFALGASGMSRHKTNFLASCRALVQGGQGDSILKDSRFGPSIVPLAQHSVIDVRIGLGRLMTAICEPYAYMERTARWIVDCLEKLSLDSSADVRAFVHRVTSSEYVEPKSVESARPRPTGTSTPSFAEFSRPP